MARGRLEQVMAFVRLGAAQLPAGVSLSVNLSPRTLLSERLSEVLGGGGGRSVVLELTEHQPVED